MRTLAVLLLSLAACAAPGVRDGTGGSVVVYGATPAGIAAALAAGRAGHDVLLLEPTGRIGGLVTNGLSHTDFRTFESVTGAFLEFTRAVQAVYAERYGPDSPQARGTFRGTHAEPRVNLEAFERLLAGVPRVRVLRRHRLVRCAREGNRIVSAVFAGPDGERPTGGFFIDATYEGDLMAAAGVPWRVGREGRAEFGESLAPERADGQLQGYNFRLIMTRDPANRVPVPAPAGYRREDHLPVVPLLEGGRFKGVFCAWTGGLYKAQLPMLPNGKADINDVSRGLVRLSLPGENRGWPDGDEAERRRIFDAHLRHNVGLLHFLQNDPAVPAAFRDEAREWGFCRDEFEASGHVPEQLYVREARRMEGVHVFTERDTDPAPGDARSVFHADAVAAGDYGPNCHGTAHEGPRFGGAHGGEFYKKVAPYQIPYGVLLPRDVENLLVPVACSSSHVGFCALRLEPIWTSLGQAAGTAAHLALAGGLRARDVPVSRLQALLHGAGSATIYVGDVPPDSPDFAAVQAWGMKGGLHGLAPDGKEPGERGRNITGQYFEAFPGHAAELDRPLDDVLRARWKAPDSARTRGEAIRSAFQSARPEPSRRGSP